MEVEMCAFQCLNSCLVSFVLSDHWNAQEHVWCLRVAQLCHVRSVQANVIGGELDVRRLCLKCAHFCWLRITFTLLPFKTPMDSDWNVFWTNLTDSGFRKQCKIYSFLYRGFLCCIENPGVFCWWLVWTNAELSPSENVFFNYLIAITSPY